MTAEPRIHPVPYRRPKKLAPDGVWRCHRGHDKDEEGVTASGQCCRCWQLGADKRYVRDLNIRRARVGYHGDRAPLPNLRATRLRFGLSARQLGKIAGVAGAVITKAELGDKQPGRTSREKIQRALVKIAESKRDAGYDISGKVAFTPRRPLSGWRNCVECGARFGYKADVRVAKKKSTGEWTCSPICQKCKPNPSRLNATCYCDHHVTGEHTEWCQGSFAFRPMRHLVPELKPFLDAVGLTQRAFARMAGVSHSAIGRACHGESVQRKSAEKIGAAIKAFKNLPK